MQTLPNGGWRILLTPGATAFPPAFGPTLDAIAQRLTAGDGRVTLMAQAPAPGLEPSFARRISLQRAISVKDALVAAGLPATRIDVRPLGRQPQGADVVDIIPPGAPRQP